jgi:hypothetical protein
MTAILERLELSEHEEPIRSCGAKLPRGPISAADLRRGYFGSQAFGERLLALSPKGDANVPLDQGQHYEDAAEQKAETIFTRELRTAAVTERGIEPAFARRAA